MRSVIGFCFLFLSTAAFSAKTEQFPRGCEPAGYHFHLGELYLSPSYHQQKQVLFLVKNNAQHAVTLRVDVPEGDLLEPNYQKILKKGQWSSFAMRAPELRFACMRRSSFGEDVYENCQQALSICQYARAKFPYANRGTYWSEYNGAQKRVVRDVIKNGVLLRW